MPYNIGDQAMYLALDAKSYLCTIIERKTDTPNGWISVNNNEGNFDYLIQYVRKGVTITEFCNEEDLTPLHPDNLTL